MVTTLRTAQTHMTPKIVTKTTRLIEHAATHCAPAGGSAGAVNQL